MPRRTYGSGRESWRPGWGLALALAVPAGAMASSSLAVDCLPDQVVWQAADPDPELRFGAANLPGIVLGPPGDSPAVQGSSSVASLGHGGSVTLGFQDIVIEDRPGADFIIFENAFFIGASPPATVEDFFVFAEPAFVEVSGDGLEWLLFPFDPQSLQQASGVAGVSHDLFVALSGLAGVTPTFTGNWTMPDERAVWDPAGTGGVSGAGGDAFDLAQVGLSEARFVRITDAGAMNGFAGAAEGFDLDGVVVLHGRPAAGGAGDQDGDGLDDLAETAIYHTSPATADSDGDGVDDGREVAGCRDAAGAGVAAVTPSEPRLWMVPGGGCTEARWTFLGTGTTFDLIRGNLSEVGVSGPMVDLGAAGCLADDLAAVAWSCDAAVPAPAQALFYLVRRSALGGYGFSSALEERQAGSGCP
ncbi:MAG: hypothetical protein ACE5HD_08770 [Acidobacteriota bacterium]